MFGDSGNNPLYMELYLKLRAMIDSGEYAVGDKLPSEKELALEHDVSRITSKHALDRLAREGLISRYPGKGSYIKASAPVEKSAHDNDANQNLRSKVHLIGVIMEGMSSDFGGDIVIGIEKKCAEEGYSPIFKFSHGDEARERACMDELISAGVEGILLMCVFKEVYNSAVMKLSLEGFPLIFMDRALNGLPIPYVGTDHYAAAVRLTGELISRGHRNIALAMTEDSHTTSSAEARVHGYVQTCIDNELLCANKRLLLLYEDPHNPDTEIRIENVNRVRKFADEHPETTAIVSLSAGIASIVLQALHGYDKKEYLMASFDGPQNVLNMPLDFIYIQQDQTAVGSVSCARLIEKIKGGSVPMYTDIPYKMISCAAGQNAMLNHAI